MQTEIVPEEQLKSEALTVVEQAVAVRIFDQPTYEAACSLLLDQIKPFRKRWADYWEAPKTAAYQAYKVILAKFQQGDAPLALAEAQVKAAIAIWDIEQERKRQELQREAERAERKAEEEARQNAAAVAEDSGASEEEVAAIVEAPILAVAQPVAPTYQRASGISRRSNWKAKVTDLHSLVKAAAKDKSLLAYLEPNETALNNRAKADRQTLNIPGVVAYDDAIVSGRSR
jgi:hypothetical protein